MDYDVLEARYVRDYIVWLRFRDGTAGRNRPRARDVGARVRAA